FAVPLRGDFEVSGELTSGPNRSMDLVYGGLRLSLKADGKGGAVSRWWSPRRRPGALEPPPKELKDWCAFRLAVRNGQYTAYANGRKVFEDKLSADADPWLFLRQTGDSSGAVRNF